MIDNAADSFINFEYDIDATTTEAEEIISAHDSQWTYGVTTKEEATEALRGEVSRLTEEVEAKNKELESIYEKQEDAYEAIWGEHGVHSTF